MSSGVISDLIAKGHMDRYLTVNPSVSFWRYAHRRHTAFACEGTRVHFNSAGTPGATAESTCTIPRNGDLITRCYLVAELPGIYNGASNTPTAGTSKVTANNDGGTAVFEVSSKAEIVWLTHGGFGSAVKEDATTTLVTPYGGGTGWQVTNEGEPYWTPSVGYAILREAKLQFGGSTVDYVYGELAYCMEELGGRPGKELTELVGKSGLEADRIADLKDRSKFHQTLYVPLPFYFTKHSGVAIQLVAMSFHDVTIKCSWRGVKELVVNGCGLGKGTGKASADDSAQVTLTTYVRNDQLVANGTKKGILKYRVGDAGTVGEKAAPTQLANSHVKLSLELEYVYLANDERSFIADSRSEKLIMTSQNSTQISTKETDIVRKLNFNHAVTEIIFAVRQQYHENRNEWLNFNGMTEPVTGRALDPIHTVSLKLNNHNRFEEKKDAKYFRTIVPYQSHNRRPDGFIYCYSFARDADSIAPTGSINMSRIDSCELILQLDGALFSNNAAYGGVNNSNADASPDVGDIIYDGTTGGYAVPVAHPRVSGGNSVLVFVYARSFNLLKTAGGVSGLGFTM